MGGQIQLNVKETEKRQPLAESKGAVKGGHMSINKDTFACICCH